MAVKKNDTDKYKDKKQKKNPTGKNARIPNEKKSAKSTIGKKQTWRAGNMLYPVPAVMVSMAREGEKPNIITVAWAGTVNSDPVMLYARSVIHMQF